jgi:RNA polymerase-binding transcription factor DksA
MTNVITFTGGKRCIECDEQINPRRLRVLPGARKCRDCQEGREREFRTALKHLDRCSETKRDRASVTIRW